MDGPIRCYFDEHVGHAIAKGLHRHSIDALTRVEADMLGRVMKSIWHLHDVRDE